MKCSICGSETEKGICKSCGYTLTSDTVASSSVIVPPEPILLRGIAESLKVGWKCPQCGSIVNPNSEVCPICKAEEVSILLKENSELREIFNRSFTEEGDLELIKAAKKCAIRDFMFLLVSHYPHSDSVVSTIEREVNNYIKSLG